MRTKVSQSANHSLLFLVNRFDLIVVFVFSILVIVSLSKFMYDSPQLAKAIMTTNWPSTEGEIIWSGLTHKGMIALHASESKTQGTRISGANQKVYLPDAVLVLNPVESAPPQNIALDIPVFTMGDDR